TGRRPIVVVDVADSWRERAHDEHHVEVMPPADDLAEQLAELSPARIVVNLLAPGALGAVAAARAAGYGARFWGCLADPGAGRARPPAGGAPRARPRRRRGRLRCRARRSRARRRRVAARAAAGRRAHAPRGAARRAPAQDPHRRPQVGAKFDTPGTEAVAF